MPKYIYQGVEFSLEEIENKAAKLGLSVDAYLSKYPEIKFVEDTVTDPTDPTKPKKQAQGPVPIQKSTGFEDSITSVLKKTKGPAEIAAGVGPVPIKQPDTDLSVEDISLDLPKPKKQSQIPQIKLPKISKDILGGEDVEEEKAAVNVREWFTKNGMQNDFTVEEPVNPLEESIRIKSNITGEKFDYRISGFFSSTAESMGLTPSLKNTDIESLNNFIYQNSRHDKTNKQVFYKTTGTPFSKAVETVSNEETFDENTYLNNFEKAKENANTYINRILDSSAKGGQTYNVLNTFKKYSTNQLLKNPEAKEEYTEGIYDILKDNNKLEDPAFSYFNKDGIKQIIGKSFESYVNNKKQENAIQAGKYVDSYLALKNIPQKEKGEALVDFFKKSYATSIEDDKIASDLFNIQNQISKLNEQFTNAAPNEKVIIKASIDQLNKKRLEYDKDFVPLADKYTGKLTYVKKENIDPTNESASDISDLVDVYKDVYSTGGKDKNALQTRGAELGKEIIANDKLGEQVLPYIKVETGRMGEFEILQNVKIKDLGRKILNKKGVLPSFTAAENLPIYDKNNVRINDKISEYFDNKVDIAAQKIALGELLFLNKSTEKQEPGFIESVADGFMESFAPESTTTKREKINLQQQIFEETGIKLTPGMKKAAVSDLVEDLGTGIGGSVKPIVEFAAINIVTAGAGSLIQATNRGAKALKWYNSLKTSPNMLGRSIYYGGQLGLEEFKTQMVGLDTGSGAAFKTFHYVLPLQFRKYIAPALQKGDIIGNRTANIIANVSDIAFGSTVRAAGAMETAAFVEHVIKEGEVSDYINENFQDVSQVGRRMLVQGLSMSWLGGKALFNKRTYYGAAQFATELRLIDDAIKRTNDATKIKRYTQAKQAIVAEMVSQRIAKDVANDETFAEIAKSDILSNWPEVKKLVESNEIDLEVKITNEPGKSNGSQEAEIIDGRLKITVNVNKAEVVETAKTQDGQEVGVVKLTSTIGHEGFHANNSAKAYNQIKNNKKVTQGDLDLQIDNEAYKSAIQILKNAEKIKKETGVDVLDIKRKSDARYSDYAKGKKTEEFIAALRDNFYEKLTYKRSSIFQVKKLINNVKQTLKIKGDVKTANEFLEMLDRLSNKKGKEKFEQDVDVSVEVVAGAKMGIEVVRKMEQRNLSEYEKLEKEKLDLELKFEDNEIEYEQLEQLLANIQLKQDRLSRTAPIVADTPKMQKETVQIGESIAKLIPKGITKKEYDNKYVGDVLTKLTETKMLDGTIRNMMTRDGIVSDNVFGVSIPEFINEVKGKGKSNAFLKSILTFNPEQNDNLGGWVINSLRGRYKDALVLFKKTQAENQAKDVTEIKDLEFDTSYGDFESMDLSLSKKGIEAKPEVSIYDRPTLKERGLINETNEPVVKKAVVRALDETSKISYSTDKSKNKRKTDLLTDFFNIIKKDKEVQKEFKRTISLKNIFEGNNKDAVIENLPTFFLGGKDTGKGVLGGMPFAIEKRVNGEWLKYPEWVGKTIDRESMAEAKAGRTSGNELTRRAPSSSVESIEAAFAKRGSDLSVYDQLLRVAAMQYLTEALGKENPNPTELKIQNMFGKVAENSDVSYEIFESSVRESAIRVMEQRDVKWNDIEPVLRNSRKIFTDLLGIENIEKLFKNNREKIVSDILKTYAPNLEDKIYPQIAKDLIKNIGGLPDFVYKTGLKDIENKIKNNEPLTDAEALLRKEYQNKVDNILERKVLSKIEKTGFINEKGELTEKGKAHIENAKVYLKENGPDQWFSSYYSNSLRYASKKHPIFNEAFLELIPGLSDMEGVVLKTYFKYKKSLRYRGHVDLDIRLAEGKKFAIAEGQEQLKKFNIRSDKFQDKIIDDVILEPTKTIEQKIEESNIIYSQNLNSAGSLASKIKFIEVDKDDKAINIESAVAEHNPPRDGQHKQVQKWILNEKITREIIKAQMNSWHLNFISKEANDVLIEAGFISKGTNHDRMQALLNAGHRFTRIENVKPDGSLKNKNEIYSGASSARVMEQRDLNLEFNKIIEANKGIKASEILSGVVARRMGNKEGKFEFFLPPSAEDFRGLYYTMSGKGPQGESDKKFFQENLVIPYTRGVDFVEKSRQALGNDFKTLNKVFKPILKEVGFPKLNKNIPDAKITAEQAIRIYLWDKGKFEIPELTEADKNKAINFVYKNPAIQSYAESLLAISKKENWSEPTEYWDTQSVLSDLSDIALNINRKQYLSEFIENKNKIFSKDNLNKIEAAYGREFRESIQDIMFRMETGGNKPSDADSITKKWTNWLNNAVGSIMFFNRRSATLQLLSTINFMNTSDNNPLKAGAAFANQPQYWKDWVTIYNSPKLKERRGGLKSDIQEAEIAAAARDSRNKPQAILSYLLKIGFTPTQIADSFAISTGGASFYRNRINTYKKQVDAEGNKLYTEKEAESKAWEDFSLISDETQQSGDPMLVSKQQTSTLGRLVLAFGNTPMQITRFQKRDFQDLKNRRRIEGKTQLQSDATYISRITYYAAVQNLIFSALQTGLFTLIPGFDDDDETDLTEKELEKRNASESKKLPAVLNSMADTTLRGSGLYGAVASTAKNVLLEYMKQQEKSDFSKDNAKILLTGLNLSPAIGSKARKFYGGFETMDFEKDVIAKRGFDIMNDRRLQLSPSYQVLGSFSSALTNLPLDRAVSEIGSISEALDSRNTAWQRLALALGWKEWEVGAEIEEHDLIKANSKLKRKEEGIEKIKEAAAEKKKVEKDALKNMNPTQYLNFKKWKVQNKGKRLYDYLQEQNKK
jgi:hypothetical protein